MDAVTYPNENVIRFVEDNLVPLQVTNDHQLATDYNITWTPSLLILDLDGNEYQRTVGFLAPEELIPSLMLGIGNTHFNRNEFNEALERYGAILADYPKSDAAAEAIFHKGVSLYKSTNDPKPLREAYDTLKSDYPDSQWTRRAYPYRLIE